MPAAFGRLCVETTLSLKLLFSEVQPPSGGCVLKQRGKSALKNCSSSAAFGRLCVETTGQPRRSQTQAAAAFGRLCVETLRLQHLKHQFVQPPSGGCVLKRRWGKKKDSISSAAFGRLCVETLSRSVFGLHIVPAAFGRLCVETIFGMTMVSPAGSSRLRAAVC